MNLIRYCGEDVAILLARSLKLSNQILKRKLVILACGLLSFTALLSALAYVNERWLERNPSAALPLAAIVAVAGCVVTLAALANLYIRER